MNLIAMAGILLRRNAHPEFPKAPKSPDFNLIENGFAKLKALLSKVKGRIFYDLCKIIGRISALFSPTECHNDFKNTEHAPK